jgi:hypothetical protein
MLGKQRLNRLQTSAQLMLDPGEPLVIADLQHVRKIVPNARHDQRVRVGHIDQCEPTPMGRPAIAKAPDTPRRDIPE